MIDPPAPTVIAPAAMMVPTKAEDRARSGGAVDLPEDVGGLCSVTQSDRAGGSRIEGGVDLEDEDRIGVALAIQRHRPGECKRRRCRSRRLRRRSPHSDLR